MPNGFNERKAAQVAAFFALKQGGSINIVKLMKLIYLGDREFLKRYDTPILHDRLVSMPKGPVNSNAYNCASGQVQAATWDSYIQDNANHMVSVATDNLTVAELKELSKAELRVLDSVWDNFGALNQWQLVEYTHDNCAEWEDPEGSSDTIPYERILRVLGKGLASREIGERIEAERAALRQLEG
jgi:uncharacterized phage-associated protein